MAILSAFALVYAEHYSLGINIADLQRHDLHGSQTGAVRDAERRGPGAALQTQHRQEHAWQLARLVDEHEMPRRLRPVDVTLKKNRSAVTVALMVGGCTPVSGQMQLERARWDELATEDLPMAR